MFLIFVLTLTDGLCCAWFIRISYLVLVLVSGDRDPTEQVSPEGGDRIQSPKRCILNKNMIMDMSRNTIFVQ
jgi:hypothetical protein